MRSPHSIPMLLVTDHLFNHHHSATWPVTRSTRESRRLHPFKAHLSYLKRLNVAVS